ncbi:hypothetical protein GETHLI_14360 [Geothrix limicola]|uniref:DUF4434 domain-containing protein n=1 Tax=Geothrix limicola TaxID=2927978 RepID=A0ABQ5QEB7_9BACT|nr:hypothetical protein [Geothrix limicola]GLH72934.1 hypothetical protein GETHLI_14360 [Geothrix limicola]
MPASSQLRRIAALALVACFLACGHPTPEPRRADQPPLALWSYRDLAGSEAAQRAFFAFAARRGVRELYLGGADLLPGRAEALGRLLDAAQDRGLRVSLVLGRAAWTRPGQRAALLEALRAVRDFDQARARAGRARLAALQLDVEPHALPDWEREAPKLSGQYLDCLEAARSELTGSLPLQVAIPVWWQDRPIRRGGRTRPLSEWAILLADQTVLMDYRNQVEGILRGAAEPMASAQALGRPVVVGLALHCERDAENAHTSFCRLGEGALQKALRQVEARLSRERAFAGFALFTYEDWESLKP